MQRVAITGSSGYVGQRLIALLRRDRPDAEILGLDIAPPGAVAPHRFERVEICEPRLADVLAGFAPDTVVHLAFILNPIHREAEMRRVNVEGTRNVLRAVAAVRPERFLFVSSAVALGAMPGNPVPMQDDHPRAAGVAFQYAADKSEAEQLVADFAQDQPRVAVSWVRPAIILGPGIDNYLSRLLLRFPVVFLLDGRNTPMQFVHVDDVVAAMLRVLERNGRGAFNVAPGNWISPLEIALETRRRVARLPSWLAAGLLRLCWACRVPLFGGPAAMLDYLRFPWVVAPERLTTELGFAFQYGSREALRSTLDTGKTR